MWQFAAISWFGGVIDRGRVTNGILTRADRQRSRRAALDASFRYASAVYANAFGCPVEPDVLDELAIEARLERLTNDAIRPVRGGRFPA